MNVLSIITAITFPLFITYLLSVFSLLLVAHRNDSQHEVNKVKRTEEHDDGKENNLQWATRGDYLWAG